MRAVHIGVIRPLKGVQTGREDRFRDTQHRGERNSQELTLGYACSNKGALAAQLRGRSARSVSGSTLGNLKEGGYHGREAIENR